MEVRKKTNKKQKQEKKVRIKGNIEQATDIDRRQSKRRDKRGSLSSKVDKSEIGDQNP